MLRRMTMKPTTLRLPAGNDLSKDLNLPPLHGVEGLAQALTAATEASSMQSTPAGVTHLSEAYLDSRPRVATRSRTSMTLSRAAACYASPWMTVGSRVAWRCGVANSPSKVIRHSAQGSGQVFACTVCPPITGWITQRAVQALPEPGNQELLVRPCLPAQGPAYGTLF